MRAILSVYDKTGIADFARGLHALGWELFSTGGTLTAISDAGVPVTSVADLTGSPEMLGGRVKTLHPKVHGGLLYRRGHAEDTADMQANAIEPIDMVVGNLYPFVATVARPGVTLPEALEEIDIGGPTMIRAAAKNHPWVIPVVDPADYDAVLEALRSSGPDEAARRALAAKAFQHVAHYDTAIAEYLRGDTNPFPDQLTVGLSRIGDQLRYGENPHQRAALYRVDSVRTPAEGMGGYVQHHGKDMSYTNFLDADAAFNLVADCPQPAVAIIKHTNPCCFATGEESLAALYERALKQGDPISAYGGIVAINRPLDMALATALRDVLSPLTEARMFYEIVIVPSYDPEALEHLKKKSKDLRILEVPLGDPRRQRFEYRAVRGGLLLQDADVSVESAFEVVSERQPTTAELADLRTAWAVCRHVKSNAIVFVKDGVLVGMGAGQPNRVESARLAAAGAGESARGAVMASDAFFPFPDSLEVAAAAGVVAAVHPGGSLRDEESVTTANALGLALCTTGVRHFRH
ncbi:MAG: bifunctional phosphoribosylaminoimidazolecarboxamide formyltransferase/IMP cyclohydrolase [Dehalococcoidia bacterium]|nr:bifunctional phosphoribosylaminoimidazolecarboxamide formyltransferase/IMP cyclohydrolase [Dehalococcoidia bacterium]